MCSRGLPPRSELVWVVMSVQCAITTRSESVVLMAWLVVMSECELMVWLVVVARLCGWLWWWIDCVVRGGGDCVIGGDVRVGGVVDGGDGCVDCVVGGDGWIDGVVGGEWVGK